MWWKKIKNFAINPRKALEATCVQQGSPVECTLKSDTYGPGGDQGGQLRLRSFERKSWRGGKNPTNC
jgi:hypothetical protein